MTLTKDNERKKEVEEVKAEGERVKAAEIADLKRTHTAAIDVLKQEIVTLNNVILSRESVINKLQSRREQLYDELVKVHADYQDFINRHPMFDPGQTKYLLPDFWANSDALDPRLDAPTILRSSNKST